MAKSFVVVGESGEYESFNRHVLGVFSSEQAALTAIADAAKRRRAYDLFYKQMNDLYASRYPRYFGTLEETRKLGYPALEEMPEYIAADKPVYEAAEQFELVTVENDVWNPLGHDGVEVEDTQSGAI